MILPLVIMVMLRYFSVLKDGSIQEYEEFPWQVSAPSKLDCDFLQSHYDFNMLFFSVGPKLLKHNLS
jgi:hypothetical protein